jgi:TonB family protein
VELSPAARRLHAALGSVLLAAASLSYACTTPPVKAPSAVTVPDDGGYAAYTQDLRERIKSKWGYPCVKVPEGNCEHKNAEVDVEFAILASGQLNSVKVVRSSGFAIYDEYVVRAIRLAAPYPPVPTTIMARQKAGSSGLTISAHFTYKVEVGRSEPK